MMTSWHMMWETTWVTKSIKVYAVHAEGLEPLFVIPDAQDNLLAPVGFSVVGPELMLNGLQMGPEHPGVHGILGGLVLICHMKKNIYHWPSPGCFVATGMQCVGICGMTG